MELEGYYQENILRIWYQRIPKLQIGQKLNTTIQPLDVELTKN